MTQSFKIESILNAYVDYMDALKKVATLEAELDDARAKAAEARNAFKEVQKADALENFGFDLRGSEALL